MSRVARAATRYAAHEWEGASIMALLRRLIGDALRAERLRQNRTLREVSAAARVSLGYLSEVERGQKEASSELLAAICRALEVRLADLLRGVSDSLGAVEPSTGPVTPVVPDTVPVSVPALEPVGADAPAAETAQITPLLLDGADVVVAA